MKNKCTPEECIDCRQPYDVCICPCHQEEKTYTHKEVEDIIRKIIGEEREEKSVEYGNKYEIGRYIPQWEVGFNRAIQRSKEIANKKGFRI